MGLSVTADGGVPIGHLPLDGNAAESPVHLQNLRALANPGEDVGQDRLALHRRYEARHDRQSAGGCCGRCPTAKALSTYKEPSHVKRRFHHGKGPLAVAPMFLEKPERMAGLLCILVWALMVMALMERQTRRSLKGKPMYGLPSPAPTGPAILQCFSTLCVVIVKEHGKISRRLAEPDPTQRKLLHLLGIPPDGLRTFKRRCGT